MAPTRPATLRPFLCWVLAATALSLFLGCSRRDATNDGNSRGNVLVRGNATEPESIDPQLVRGQVEWNIVGGLFEGLVTPDPVTLEPRPAVAEHWEVNDDATKFIFHLRPDARWSDGAAVKAADFVFAAQRMLSPRLASPQPEDSLFFVRGARDFQANRTSDFNQVGIRILDTNTLAFELERPTPFFPSALCQFYPVRRDVIEKYGPFDDRGNSWAQPGKLIGNGPFTLEGWEHGKRIVLKKNPHYRDAGHVALEGVQFLPIDNAAMEESAFRTGQLDVTFTVPFAKLDNYQRLPNSPLRQVEDRGVYFYTVNVNRAPVNDRRVRQALSLAIDRQKLCEVMLKGAGVPATAFTPPCTGGWYTPSELVCHDPDRARALLAEAGYPGGRGMPPVEILFDSREYHRVIAEVIQQMWRQTLGIQAVLRNHETQVVIASKNQMDFQLARGWWNATTYQDPFYFLGAWRTGALFNEAGWSNKEFDSAIDATWTADQSARAEAFKKAEAIFLQELPAIPIFYSRPAILVSPRVKGMPLAPFGDRRLKEFWIKTN